MPSNRSLQINVRQLPHGIVVSAAGEAGMLELPELTQQLQSVVAAAPSLVVLELSGLTMIASAGMGTLIGFRRDIARSGGKVRLAALRPQVKEAFHRAFLHKIFEMYDMVDSALN